MARQEERTNRIAISNGELILRGDGERLRVGGSDEYLLPGLVNIQAKANTNLSFSLGCNIHEAEPFGDLLLKLCWEENGKRSLVYLCHTKTEESIAIEIEHFFSDVVKPNFYLRNYFEFYKKLKSLCQSVSSGAADNLSENEKILGSCQIEQYRFAIHSTYSKLIEFLEPLDNSRFRFHELLCTTATDRVYTFSKESPVWDLYAGHEDCEIYQEGFLPNVIIYTGQANADNLRTKIKSHFDGISKEHADMLLNAYTANIIKSWWSGKEEMCLSESSTKVEECLKIYIETLNTDFPNFVFRDEICKQFQERITTSNLIHVVLPGIPSGSVSAVKMMQSCNKDRYFLLRERIVASFCQQALLDICNKLCLKVLVEIDKMIPETLSFLESITSKNNIQVIIFSNGNNVDLSAFLEGRPHDEIEDLWYLDQLNPISQNKILQKTVLFQGVRMQLLALKKTVPMLEKCIDGPTIIALNKGEHISIGTIPPQSKTIFFSRYLETYIPSNDSSNFLKKSISISNRGTLKILGRVKENISALESNVSSKDIIISFRPDMLYKSSQTEDSNRYFGDRSIIVKGTSGSGKSELLRRIWKDITLQNPNSLVLFIDLNICHKELRSLPVDPMDIHTEHMLQFLAEASEGSSKTLIKSMIKNCLLFSDNAVVLLDSLSEICPAYKKKVMKIIDLLMQTKMAQLWVSSRLDTAGDLERKMNTVSFRLEEFDTRTAIRYVCQYLLNEIRDIEKVELFLFLERIIKSNRVGSFCRMPLHAHTLAISLTKTLTSPCLKLETVCEETSILYLVEIVIMEKFCIHWRKAGVQRTEDTEVQEEHLIERYKEIAKTCVSTSENTLPDNRWNLPDEFLCIFKKDKTGVIEMQCNETTFYSPYVEYFAARALEDAFITNEPSFRETFQAWRFDLVHHFFDASLARKRPLHEAVLTGNLSIVEGVLQSTRNINEIDSGGRNALHLAANHCSEDIIKTLILAGVDHRLRDRVMGWTPPQYYGFKRRRQTKQ